MKKIACLLAVLVMLLPLSASAISQEEWNQKCRSKTGGAVTIYAIDVASDGTKTTREIDVIPEGQYVAIGGADYDLEMRLVGYFEDGVQKSGYARKDAPIVDATQFVHFTNGTSLPLPEALANDRDALEAYVARFWPELTVQDDGAKPTLPEQAATQLPAATATPMPSADDQAEAAATAAPKQTSGSSSKSSAASTSTSAGIPALYGNESVTVDRLGLASSTIITAEGTFNVPTCELTFGGNTDDSRRIAVIWAPNSGQCTLREAPQDNADSIDRCAAGTIVAVLEVGEGYTQIAYEDAVGYVQTRLLQFHRGDAEILGTGMLTYNGHGNGSTTINVRNDADRETAKIAEWRTGTTVTVLSLDSGWYEIECEGLRGYVMDVFLTMQK